MGPLAVKMLGVFLNLAVIVFVVVGAIIGVGTVGGGSTINAVIGAFSGLLVGAIFTGFGFVLLSINDHLKSLVELSTNNVRLDDDNRKSSIRIQ